MRCPHTLVKFVLLLAALFLPWLVLLPDSQGAEAWPVRYNGPGNGDDRATALVVDDQGNVYVTGWSAGTSLLDDYATIKYSPSGDRIWAKRYNGPGNNSDIALALAVDAQGNVYVTGYSAGDGTNFDYATLKYSPSGERLWTRRYNGPGNGEDTAFALAVDAEGNVYVTGESGGPGSSEEPYTLADYATLKYSPAGDLLWAKRYNGPGKFSDYAQALALDAQGNVYVTGWSTGEGSGSDYVTFKYNQE